jgi:hypothetical protein
MPRNQRPASGPARRPVRTALWLVSASVGFGIVSGIVAVTAGLREHGLSVFAIGLSVMPT